MREIVFAGFGGQGVLTAGLIVSQIALYKGFHATWMPAYGAAQRGGTANCTVKYGPEKITNPGQQKPDLVLGMNDMFRKKGKSKFEAQNVAAFEAGYHALES